LESLNALEPDTTFVPSAVDSAVADGVAALMSGDEAALLRAQIARGLHRQRALSYAIQMDNADLVREVVLQHGADPNVRNDGGPDLL